MHFDNEETSAILSAPPDPSAIQSTCWNLQKNTSWYIHTYIRLTALCPRLPGWAGTRKVKPIWILLEQETVSGSGISWAVCKSAPRSRQITTPAPHHSVFLQAGCPSCRPTNNVTALKAKNTSWRKEKSKPQNTDRRHNFNKSNCKILRGTFSTQNLNMQTLKVLLKYNPKCQTLTSD